MARVIESIEGIGFSHGQRLREAGVSTTEALLELGRRPGGRREIAQQSGIPEKQILRWVNMADLFRVSGVAGQYAELLERAGVDTVKELRNRNAENLTAKLSVINQADKVCGRSPSVRVVQGWIDQAKTLPAVVEY